MKPLFVKQQSSLARVVGASIAIGLAASAQATVVVLDKVTDAADIAAFMAGASVENFENLTALTITDYSAVDAGGFTFSSRDPDNAPTYDSTGASPGDPKSNPGVPVGIFKPSGGIAGDVSSPSNVAGAVVPFDFGAPTTPPLTAFGSAMEVAMPKDKNAIKVGFYVTHGSVLVQAQGENNGNPLDTLDSTTASAGSFVAFTRGTADIRNVSIVGSGDFTIDDFTYAFSASSGGGGGGGGGSTVPDTGNALNLLLAAGALGLFGRKFRPGKA